MFKNVVKPGESINVGLALDSNVFPKTGEYIVAVDLVHEGKTWFEKRGSSILSIPVKIDPISKVTMGEDDLKNPKTSKIYSTNSKSFDFLWDLISSTLSFNCQEFKLNNKVYGGFSAGSVYPQFWVRDNNTIIPGAQWFFNKTSFLGWIQLHLEHQRPNGYINDWVDSNGLEDKNTVETDQETSLVQGAYSMLEITGDVDWLHTNTKQISNIARLDMALSYVWNQKRDPKTGLLIGAHTIDWGDVDNTSRDQQATKVGRNTIWTVDIYDQSMFVIAAKDLASIYGNLLHDSEKATTWQERANFIQKKTRDLLWQSDKGYFRVHIHVTPFKHPFNEDELFAMGGNTMAIESGIATEEMARQIFNTAIKRQKQYGLSTIGGVMIPPYPDDTFIHPLVKKQYSYQNGGQWDWFAGRLILAMYQSGYSEQATAGLEQIAKTDVMNKGIYEWEDRNGKPQGSNRYSGAAAVLANALVKGYYGIDSTFDSLTISPRLGEDSAQIALRQPANNNRYVSYKYGFDSKKKQIQILIHSNYSGKCDFNIKLPNSMNVANSVITNQIKLPIKNKIIGKDSVVSFQVLNLQNPTLIEIH